MIDSSLQHRAQRNNPVAATPCIIEANSTAVPQSPVPIDRPSKGLSKRSYRAVGSVNVVPGRDIRPLGGLLHHRAGLRHSPAGRAPTSSLGGLLHHRAGLRHSPAGRAPTLLIINVGARPAGDISKQENMPEYRSAVSLHRVLIRSIRAPEVKKYQEQENHQ